MPNWLNKLIEPKSRSDEGRRREFILNILLACITAVSLIALMFIVPRFIIMGPRYTGEPPLFAVLQVVLFVGLWVLSRKGFIVPAAYALVATFLLLTFHMLIGWGIMLPQALLLLALVIVMASILLGTKVGFVVNLLSGAALIVLGWLQQSGQYKYDTSWMSSPGGPVDGIGFALTFAVITAVSWLSNREIERFNATLQERIHQATQRLRSANRNLKVLDKAKDDFISMASHQLGTPLTAITGYLSIALDDDKGNMTPNQREYINFALEASERMTAMSGDLLNVSRLNSGRFIIQRQDVDINSLVKQEVGQLRMAAQRKGLSLNAKMATGLPTLNIDESKTRQVIMNFIDNAIYYTQRGSINVETKLSGGRVYFTVTDTGIGVPASEHQKLFAKFYRATNAQAVRPDGTGLGLYLAKQVVEEQGGTIIFRSEEGKGSVFGFSLPTKNASVNEKTVAN